MSVDLSKFRGAKRGPLCRVSQALGLIDPDDARDFVDSFHDPTCVGTLIAAGLNEYLEAAGHEPNVGVQTLQRHRRRVLGAPGDACTCPVPERA